MKITVSVEIEDFVEYFGQSLSQRIKDEITNEIIKSLKRDPRYKALIEQKIKESIETLS